MAQNIESRGGERKGKRRPSFVGRPLDFAVDKSRCDDDIIRFLLLAADLPATIGPASSADHPAPQMWEAHH